MLDPKTAIREEWRNHGKKTFRHFIFICTCGAEIALPNSKFHLQRATGLCTKCVPRSIPNPRIRKRPFEALFNCLKKTAHKIALPVTLSYEEFLEFTDTSECHYCGFLLYWTAYNLKQGSCAYNLDRKDNNQGYSKENCVTCCRRCNTIKSNWFTYEEMMLLSPQLHHIRGIQIERGREIIPPCGMNP